MAKHKSPQELMAQRNPLNRTAVAPVDIYNQPPEPVQVTPKTEPKPEVKSDRRITPRVVEKPIAKPTTPKVQDETDSPYSTYLFKKQVKGIKLRAIEEDVNDKEIVQRAIDEYFKNHPL